MAKKPSFNFGASAKPRKTKGTQSKKSGGGKGGSKSNAWRAYTGSAPAHSSAPIPD